MNVGEIKVRIDMSEVEKLKVELDELEKRLKADMDLVNSLKEINWREDTKKLHADGKVYAQF